MDAYLRNKFYLLSGEEGLLLAGYVPFSRLWMLVVESVRVAKPVSQRVHAAEEPCRRLFETQRKIAVGSVRTVIGTCPPIAQTRLHPVRISVRDRLVQYRRASLVDLRQILCQFAHVENRAKLRAVQSVQVTHSKSGLVALDERTPITELSPVVASASLESAKRLHVLGRVRQLQVNISVVISHLVAMKIPVGER